MVQWVSRLIRNVSVVLTDRQGDSYILPPKKNCTDSVFEPNFKTRLQIN